MGFDWQVTTDLGIHQVFHRTDFRGLHRFKMREVETQHFVVNQRTFLGNVGTQHVAQSSVHQVGCRVVQTNARTASFVNVGLNALAHFQRA